MCILLNYNNKISYRLFHILVVLQQNMKIGQLFFILKKKFVFILQRQNHYKLFLTFENKYCFYYSNLILLCYFVLMAIFAI